MKITKRQLRSLIKESLQPEREHEGTPLNQMPAAWRQILGGCLKEYGGAGRENVSGSLGELIRIASDAIHTADGDTDLAFDDLWNDSQVTDFIEQVLSDRGADFTDSEISYLLQAATDIASMVIDGSYNSSQAHAELSSEFDGVSGGGTMQPEAGFRE